MRPLAIRAVSLRRYIDASMPTKARPAPSVRLAPEVVAAAGPEHADLSGVDGGADDASDAEAAADEEGSQRPPKGMQRLASTARQVMQDTLAL